MLPWVLAVLLQSCSAQTSWATSRHSGPRQGLFTLLQWPVWPRACLVLSDAWPQTRSGETCRACAALPFGPKFLTAEIASTSLVVLACGMRVGEGRLGCSRNALPTDVLWFVGDLLLSTRPVGCCTHTILLSQVTRSVLKWRWPGMRAGTVDCQALWGLWRLKVSTLSLRLV